MVIMLNIYLCTFWDADMCMFMRSNPKVSNHYWMVVESIKSYWMVVYEQLRTFYGKTVYTAHGCHVLQDMDIMDLFTNCGYIIEQFVEFHL